MAPLGTPPSKKPFSPLALAAFAGLTASAAAVGAQESGNTLWYRRLKKPPFQPPPSVFGPVWGVLYGLIAYSGYRVWKHRKAEGGTRALGLWGVQMALNGAWSYLFFKKKQPRAALADIGLLLGAVSLYTNAARRVDKPAAWMMAPYLAWVSFASALNEEIVRRNA